MSVTAGNTYEFLPTADDPDGDSLTFSISATPGWATFDTNTGRLTGVPTNADARDYRDIVISVSDGALSTSLSAFTITVATATVNSPPTIGGTPAPSVVQNSLYSFTPVASDPDGDALTFTIQGMPSWATFDELSGTLMGTPAQGDVDTYPNMSITVSDGSSTSSLPVFSITVND
ncbi:MAG: hypothetical protein HKN81_12265, partial [Gammaproteobacteria bacterium]|nr:hypothetical protein [Gammaproteobacteria bacterium]